MNAEDQVADSSKSKDEEIESRSSGSGNMKDESKDDDDLGIQGRKKQFHRHSAHQIQQMEMFFKECQHPDEKQRLRLSHELGLTPRQVKFWFQNRRTQMKAQQDRLDNLTLRNENDYLKAENYKLRVALRNFVCPNCSGSSSMGDMPYDAHQLRFENASLREELARMYGVPMSSRPLQNPEPVQPSLDLDIGSYSRQLPDSLTLSTGAVAPSPPLPTLLPAPESGAIGLLESETSLALELAVHATEQLLRLSREGEPLWVRVGDRSKEVLNLEEHGRTFHWPVNFRPGVHNLRTEASRDTALVFINLASLVNAFMDADKWMMMFPSVVARASTIQVISRGVGTEPSGQLQLMYAEFMYPSPLLMTRECYFLRACHQTPEGMWLVVDFPIDGFNCTLAAVAFSRFRRHLSGIVINDVSNGYCRATWVEHVEAEDRALHHIFNPLLLSGGAFAAQRWIASLQRYAERVALTSPHALHCNTGIINSVEGRRNLMQLAQRMVKMFSVSISPARRQQWTSLAGPADDTIRMTTRRCTDPGHPHGAILSAVSATWLPFSQFQVFEFLRSEKNRSQLDAFSGGSTFQEISRIATGSHPGNYIALLRINSPSGLAGPSTDLMIQESFIDACGSMICYAPVGASIVDTVMTSGDMSYIPLLPCGFFIIPASGGHSNNDTTSGFLTSNTDTPSSSIEPLYSNGCILTVAFQVLASASSTSKISMSTVNSLNTHICNAVRQIHDAIKANSMDPFPSPSL